MYVWLIGLEVDKPVTGMQEYRALVNSLPDETTWLISDKTHEFPSCNHCWFSSHGRPWLGFRGVALEIEHSHLHYILSGAHLLSSSLTYICHAEFWATFLTFWFVWVFFFNIKTPFFLIMIIPNLWKNYSLKKLMFSSQSCKYY